MKPKVNDLERKTYLGDGVYADYDGDRLILTTEDGLSVTNTIYIERGVFEALIAYVARLKEEL